MMLKPVESEATMTSCDGIGEQADVVKKIERVQEQLDSLEQRMQ